MKRRIKTILVGVCCSLLALLTACGGLGGGQGGGDGGLGGGGNHEGMLSVRDDIDELGENVDNVPYLGATDETSNGGGGSTPHSTANSKSSTPYSVTFDSGKGSNADKPMFPDPNQPGANWGNIVDKIDVNSPEDDVYFNDYASSRQYVSPCAELFYISAANNVLDFDVKYVKENVFQNVTMLNRWIRHTDHSMLRMRYDQVNNVLYCEELSSYVDPLEGPYFHYHCTTSSYTPDGKEIIEYISTRQPSIGDFKYSKFYRYIEDKEQLYFTVHDQDMYGVVYSDLSKENPLVTAFVYEKSTVAEILPGQTPGAVYETISKEIYIPQSDTDCGFAASERTGLVDGVVSYTDFAQTLIDSHGLYIGTINNGGFSISLPYISNLDYSISFKGGIDVIRFMEDGEYRDSLSTEDYIANNVTYNFNLGGLEFTKPEDVGLPLLVMGGIFDSKTMYFHFEDDSQLLSALENSGLELEPKYKDQVERYVTRNEFMSTHSMYGYTLDSTLTSDIIYDIFMRYINTFSHVSDEELQSYKVSDALPRENQTEDEQYYAIYNVEFTGSISVDAENMVDISNIVATMPENLALNGGERLSLVAVYSTGCDTYELMRKSFTYHKEDLTMSFDAGSKVFIPEMNGEGQFYFYVINESNKSMRVSTTFTPTCAEVDTVITGGASVKRLYLKDGKLFVNQAPTFTKTFSVENQTVASPVRFVQTASAFVEGDYAIVTINSGNTVVGQFTYDFDQNINPASVTLDSGIDTNSIYYVLTIYNADGAVLHTETL